MLVTNSCLAGIADHCLSDPKFEVALSSIPEAVPRICVCDTIPTRFCSAQVTGRLLGVFNKDENQVVIQHWFACAREVATLSPVRCEGELLPRAHTRGHFSHTWQLTSSDIVTTSRRRGGKRTDATCNGPIFQLGRQVGTCWVVPQSS